VLDAVITVEASTLCDKLTITEPGVSDHILTVANLHVGRLKPVTRLIKYRKIKTVDITAFAD